MGLLRRKKSSPKPAAGRSTPGSTSKTATDTTTVGPVTTGASTAGTAAATLASTAPTSADPAAAPVTASPEPTEAPEPAAALGPDTVDELRRAATEATSAAERAHATAEAAQRQALLATETARAVTDGAPPAITAEQFIALTAEVEKLSALVRSSITESREARELVATVDERITRLGVELARQIDELSGDVDALAERDPADALPAETVADLRSGQVRLAQEQARYQIAFRQDLAAIADEVRKRPAR